jgi:ribonuclease Z
MNAVSKLFLTHLHSDHVIGVPDLMLTPWSAAPERKVPLEVRGPDGTRDMMRHLEEAFAFDIHMRRDVDESFSRDGIRMVAHDIQPGKVYEKNGVTVTAFLVSHGLVKPSYGYRVDYAGRSVAFSGDTSPSANLVAVRESPRLNASRIAFGSSRMGADPCLPATKLSLYFQQLAAQRDFTIELLSMRWQQTSNAN